MLTQRQNDKLIGLIGNMLTTQKDLLIAKHNPATVRANKILALEERYRDLYRELSEKLDEMTVTVS